MINKDELLYKINTIIRYLKEHNGYDYKLYNRLCPGMGDADSNIVEYAEDVMYSINKLLDENNTKNYTQKNQKIAKIKKTKILKNGN